MKVLKRIADALEARNRLLASLNYTNHVTASGITALASLAVIKEYDSIEFSRHLGDGQVSAERQERLDTLQDSRMTHSDEGYKSYEKWLEELP